ncbi:MAG: preprotein translocase subunit SecG [Phycisphaerales bacterium]
MLFNILTFAFTIVSVSMVLIILVQRPQGGGLAGAFGGAGGSSSDTVFGGRVGDALTWATVVAFVVYLCVGVAINLWSPSNPRNNTAATADVTGGAASPEGATVGEAIEGAIEGAVDDTIDAATDTIDGATDAIGDAVDAAGDAAGDVVDDVTGGGS